MKQIESIVKCWQFVYFLVRFSFDLYLFLILNAIFVICKS